MTPIQIIVLAIVQGLTEFLPISSSGHLILVPSVLGWEDQGVAFDVAVHFGTLAGVVGYFRRDLTAIVTGLLAQFLGRGQNPEARLGWMLVAASIPVALVGFLLHDWIAETVRTPIVIAAATGVFALLLWAADRSGRRDADEMQINLSAALYIGCAQILALIPGTSRSGVTMTAALSLGLGREAAARFSLLLSIPVIVLAAGLETTKLVAGSDPVVWTDLLLAAGVSAVVAYLTIRVFLRFVSAIGMAPFAIYRIVLALVIVYVLV